MFDGRSRKIWPLAAGVLWIVVVCLGMGRLINYENSPGPAAEPPAQWPSDSRVSHSRNHATLVMFAHPRCPCTRATIGELELIMARCQGQLKAYVLFVKSPGVTDDWVKTDLWRTAIGTVSAFMMSAVYV